MDTKIAPGRGIALQRRKRRDCRLTNKARKVFLDHLAATCNARASAAAAGYAGTSSFYALKREDEAFAAAWREAMRIGYDRLEEALLARALGQLGETARSGDPGDTLAVDPDAVAIELVDERGTGGARPASGSASGSAAGLAMAAGLPAGIARIDIQLALAMLNRHEAIARKGPAKPRGRATADEVASAVSAKLDRLADQLARQQR